MAFADNLPISECLGVFVGVSGFDWLTDGRAEPLKAVVIALSAGALLMIIRLWRRHRRKD